MIAWSDRSPCVVQSRFCSKGTTRTKYGAMCRRCSDRLVVLARSAAVESFWDVAIADQIRVAAEFREPNHAHGEVLDELLGSRAALELSALVPSAEVNVALAGAYLEMGLYKDALRTAADVVTDDAASYETAAQALEVLLHPDLIRPQTFNALKLAHLA